MELPQNYYFSKEHEWVKVDGNICTIGITEYAQAELGDIVFVELPELDTEISAGDSFGSVESTKAVSELYTPISGKVIAINEDLANSPELVNQSPYNDAWMIKVEFSDKNELEALMNASEYKSEVSG